MTRAAHYTRRQSLGLLAIAPVAASGPAWAADKPLKGIMRIVTTPEMLDYARHAEELEADAVIAMPPSAPNEQTVEGFHAYFAALAKAVRRPVVIQTDLAGGRALTPPVELLLRLAREFPGRIYV